MKTNQILCLSALFCILFLLVFLLPVTASQFPVLNSVTENGEIFTFSGDEQISSCAENPPLPPNTTEIAYDDGCWDSWGYNVQNKDAVSNFSYQGVRVRFTAPAAATGIVKEARVVNWHLWAGNNASFVVYDQFNNVQGSVTVPLNEEGEKFQVIDLSSVDFAPGPGNDFYIAFEPAGDVCLPGTNGLVVGDDDSSPISGRSELRSGDCPNEWRVMNDVNHLIRAVVSTTEDDPGECQLDIDLAYQNGLEINVTVKTSERAFLNVWVAYMNKIVPVMRGVRLPPGNDPREIPIVLNGFPQVGKIAVLGTLVSTDRSKGILCSDLGTGDTGALAGQVLDDFEIDRLMQKFKNMIQ